MAIMAGLVRRGGASVNIRRCRWASRLTLLFLVFLSGPLWLSCSANAQADSAHPTTKGGSMLQLTSSSFSSGGSIPRQFTCEGEDISPELSWKNAPSGTKTFALIVHDPDAPRAGGFTHWVVYNIPASATHIAQSAAKSEKLPDGGIQGKNDFGQIGYKGPCPPSGTHRYY